MGSHKLVALLCLVYSFEALSKETCADERKRLLGGNFKPDEVIPECEEDGSYTLVQCNKDKKLCRCVAPDGTLLLTVDYIYGKSTYCSCARDKFLSGGSDKGFNCDEKTGNYGPIRCSSEGLIPRCFCVDENGEEIEGSSIHYNENNELTC